MPPTPRLFPCHGSRIRVAVLTVRVRVKQFVVFETIAMV
jgi:hypothetical protein